MNIEVAHTYAIHGLTRLDMRVLDLALSYVAGNQERLGHDADKIQASRQIHSAILSVMRGHCNE